MKVRQQTPASKREYTFNLGFPGLLLAIFVSLFFAIRIAQAFAILSFCGWHAFFKEGVYLKDWRHLALSSGATLPWWGALIVGPGVISVWGLLILGTEFAASWVRAFLSERAPLATVTARLVGGTVLLAFSYWAQSPYYAGLILFARLSAFVGGLVLLGQAIATSFRRPSS